MNSVFIPLFSIYQTCQTEVKLFQCFAFSLATCMKNQEQSIAWTKRVHHLSWLSETINILFYLCTFKPDIDSHAPDLSFDAVALATLDPFLPPRLTVRTPETLKRQSLADPNCKYFMTLQLHEIKSRKKPFIYIAFSKGGVGGVYMYEPPQL